MGRFAIVLAVLSACGDGKNDQKPDAAGPSDGDNPDAPYDPVTLTIVKENAPQAGVLVVFQNADSSLVSSTTTDATGRASARMAAGGYVTAINPFDTPQATIYDDLRTFVGVKPGDNLVLEIPLILSTHVTITAPRSTAATAAYYYVYSPCNLVDGMSITAAGTEPLSAQLLLDGCGTATDVIVAALDDNFEPVEYIYAANVAVSEGATIDLTASSYATAPTRSFTFTNIPTGYSAIAIYDTLVSPHGPIARISKLATAGVAQLRMPAFLGANDIVRARTSSALGIHTMVDWGPYASAYMTDVGARLLPDVAAAPSIDAAASTVSWTEASGGVAPDFTEVAIAACRTTDMHCWDWFAVGPHADASLELPKLPTMPYDYNLSNADTLSLFDFFYAKVPGGYDGVRAHVFAATRPVDLVTGATGAITYVEMAPQL